MRQIILDTETTGLEPSQGHRIIEIGCVEMVNRRLTDNRFHRYLNPQREIDEGAIEVHGITNEQLIDKPYFADVAEAFLEFIRGAELIIHNAPFDVGFLNHELSRLPGERRTVADCCPVVDTLILARRMHPGQRNSLDALCKRYGVDNSQRELHGALLDAEILADVYLAMTGGQASLSLSGLQENAGAEQQEIRPLDPKRPPLKIIRADEKERAAHDRFLTLLDRESGGNCGWRQSAE